MAVTINFRNADRLVFQNQHVKRLLPDFRDLFQTYGISRQTPELKAMGQKAIIDFVNGVKEDHVKVLREHFKDDVVVEKIDTNVVSNHEYQIDEAEVSLNAQTILKEAFFAYREGDRLYISFWR